MDNYNNRNTSGLNQDDRQPAEGDRQPAESEPNFILKDTPPTEERTDSFDTGQPTQATGSYTDPRAAFRNRKATENRESTESRETYGSHPGGYTADPASANQTNRSYYENAYDTPQYGRNTGSGSGRPRKEKKPSPPVTFTRKSLALLLALCLVVSCLFGGGSALLISNLLSNNHGSTKTASATTTGYTLEDATGSNMTVQEITEEAKPSVVEIKTESVSSDTWMQQYVTEGAGSGVVITNDGYIVTNNHVIDGASKITVTTSDETEYEAKLIGTDSITDIAVLKIDAKGLTPATYGNSDQLAVGDMAVAIGNPLGELGGTVTAGIISALDRELAIDGKTMTLLQTDSSINPGNSGGGLFNGDGQLIGIVVAKSSGSDVEGLGFAIPINKAADVAQQLMDQGYVSGQPSSGMTYTESGGSQTGMSQYFSGSSSSNVYIYSVDGENAKDAGFQQGDLVYQVDGEDITSFNALSSIITSHDVGDTLTYTIVRNNQTMKIKLKLQEKTAEN